MDKSKKKLLHKHNDKARLQKMWNYEHEIIRLGYKLIAGIDEAGRGPLAGPVVAAAVILPVGCYIESLNDSKKLSPAKRELVYSRIRELALAVSCQVVSSEYIDKYNIYNATIEAMRRSIEKLSPAPEYLLVDAVKIKGTKIPQQAIIHGDSLSASIAAASIVAKVERDKIMVKFDEIYPEYNFAKHKGYPTPEHIAAIRNYGPCPIHRKSFHPKALREGALKNEFQTAFR